ALAYRNASIGQAAAADGREHRELDDQAFARPVVVGQGVEAGQLLALRALAVVRVQEGEVVVASGGGGGDRGVHASADAHDGQGTRPAQMPRSTPGQRYLWSWTCTRAGRPSSRIQRASSPGASTSCTGENSTVLSSVHARSRTRARDHS